MKYLLSITLTLVLAGIMPLCAQEIVPPKVFLIGEHEEQYLSLSQSHPVLFMSLFDNDLDRAFKSWSDCLVDMEEHAASIDFDIRGTRLWLNLYFNPDGTIAHLAYYPKPNSRQIPEEHLTAFFKNFIRVYRMPMQHDRGFQHSTSAAFPTFFSREQASKN